MMLGQSHWAGRQRGAAAVEVSLLVPLLCVLLAVVAGGWRIGWARAQIVEAAAAGARAATITNSASQARLQAEAAIAADLQTVGVRCAELVTLLDTAAFANPPGHGGQVIAQVSCQLRLSDLVAPGLPGAVQISASASEPLDTFRERQP